MTYAELVQAVKDYLEIDQTTFNANIDNFIKLAESDIYRQVQMPFATDVETTVNGIAIGQKFYTLPDDFLSQYHFAIILDSGAYHFLLPKDHSLVNEISGTNGLPRYYAIYDTTEIIFGPASNAEYDVELSYYRMPPSLVDTPSGNWLSEFGEQALLFGVILQGYIFLKGDQDTITHYTNQYQGALASLKVITEGRQLKDNNRNPERRLPS
jgi:hypothetical protein